MTSKDNRELQLFQLLVGEPAGGAERFFVKLAIALQEREIPQLIAIQRDKARAEELRDGGCTVEEFDFSKSLGDLFERRRLNAITKRFNPNMGLAWMNRAARRMPPGKFAKAGRIGGYYKAKNYKRCQWIIANSPDLRRHIIEDGWDDDHAVMISNFGELSPKPAVNRSEFNTPEDAVLFLALGRLHPSKGFDLLIEALTTTPDAYLWIGGTGNCEQDLKTQVEHLNLSDRVRFLGWRDDQAALLAACDVCVVPSRHEPLSNVVIEAWSLGVPVIATASEGPSWLIDNEVNGLLTPLNELAPLSNGLNTLCQNENLRMTIAKGGQTTWQERFSKDAIVDQYLEFFERAIEEYKTP